MKLEDMSLEQKRFQLQSLSAKAELDVDYSSQVRWGDKYDEVQRQISILIQNYDELFKKRRIDSLDYDVRQSTIFNYNAKFDELLKRFPEFDLDRTQEIEKQGPRL